MQVVHEQGYASLGGEVNLVKAMSGAEGATAIRVRKKVMWGNSCDE